MTTPNKIYKGLMVLEEFKNIPLEGFYKIDTNLIRVLNKRLRNDNSELWKSYIQAYGYGVMYLHEFLLTITKNNNLPYKDGYLVLKSLDKLNDPVLKNLTSALAKGTLDEYNTIIAFDRTLNDLPPIVGEQGYGAIDKSLQSEDVTTYKRYLSKASTPRAKMAEVYNKIFNIQGTGEGACNFLHEVQESLPQLINKEVRLIEVYNRYINEKQPSSEQIYFDSIIEGIKESFDASNLKEYYDSYEEFVSDHTNNNFVTLAEKKWATEKICGDDAFKIQCVNNTFDEIFCNDIASLMGKRIYRTKDESMISNYIDAIDNAIEMGFITNDEWGQSFLKDTFQQCFAMI